MTYINEKALFDAVRQIKGKGLLQFDVDLIKRALAAELEGVAK